MNKEPEWFQQVLDRTEQTESNLTKRTDMEHHTIELEDNTSLEIEYEVDAGVEGSYHEAPSNGFISIQSCKLCQHNGKQEHKVELYGIDDTLFPVDFDMIEHIIIEELRK